VRQAGVGRRIRLAVGAGFVLVLVVGGISVLLAWAIWLGVAHGRQQSVEVQALDQIHQLVHHFTGDLHLLLLTGQAPGHGPPGELLDQLKARISAYEALERAQESEEAREELARLRGLRALLARLEAESARAVDASRRGQPLTATELAALNELAHEQVAGVIQDLHDLHRQKLQRTIDESQARMLLISSLYVGFALAGGSLLLFGNRFLSRTLVTPITRLAQAALHIAGGDLARRVPVRSSDEVGQLSRAFNLMAERLEAHEVERASFEATLERQVKERTRELEETTARLRTTQAELVRAERIAVTGHIAAGVTHEIRTPLNSLAINVQLLRRELSPDAPSPSFVEVHSSLATVEYEITRINRILEEFVNFARLPVPRFERLQGGLVVHEVLGLLAPQAAGAGVRIEAPDSRVPAWVQGDRDQLREVFLNLGQNALQAMPNGGVLGVEIQRDREWVEIAVTDRGPGVPEEDRERIFLPFVSTKADGLGLGLPIVSRIVEEHGGSVCCRNRVGGGTTFLVRLLMAGTEG